MTVTCPQGHESSEPDYCSVCGAPMGGAGPAGGAHGEAGAGEACPTCGSPRADVDARFCEVCRYDFDSRTPGPPPVAPTDPPPPDPAPPPAVAPPSATPAAGWEVIVAIDPSLDVEPDPSTPAPTDAGERIFPVDLPEMLIGRRDEAHDIRPEIPVRDPAVSRRHAKLLRAADGGLAVLDLASANGTAVNGQEIAAGERHSLTDGDQLTMGRWTRVTVRRPTAS